MSEEYKYRVRSIEAIDDGCFVEVISGKGRKVVLPLERTEVIRVDRDTRDLTGNIPT